MSTSNAQGRALKARGYRLGRRAEQQQQTRQRIVEAAVDLHCTVGPARTTVTQIAEKAGVQRHTVYAHFPDERSLFRACSELALSRDPLPDVESWRALAPGRHRAERGLRELYAWYQRNAGQAGCVLRDAEHHAPTREIVDARLTPTFDLAAQLLTEAVPKRSVPLVRLAIGFACWRSLSETLDPNLAAGLMADAIFCPRDQ